MAENADRDGWSFDPAMNLSEPTSHLLIRRPNKVASSLRSLQKRLYARLQLGFHTHLARRCHLLCSTVPCT